MGIERNKEVHLFKDKRVDYMQVAKKRLQEAGAEVIIRRRA